MADINIKYTEEFEDGTLTTIRNTYQCEYPSVVFVNNDNDEIVYITEKNPVTRETYVHTQVGSFLFKEGYIYFVRITDLVDNELVENTRIYQTGREPHGQSYMICEDSKCKVNVPRERIDGPKLLFEGEWDGESDLFVKDFDKYTMFIVNGIICVKCSETETTDITQGSMNFMHDNTVTMQSIEIYSEGTRLIGVENGSAKSCAIALNNSSVTVDDKQYAILIRSIYGIC